jgi:hypothetical protein
MPVTGNYHFRRFPCFHFLVLPDSQWNKARYDIKSKIAQVGQVLMHWPTLHIHSRKG